MAHQRGSYDEAFRRAIRAASSLALNRLSTTESNELTRQLLAQEPAARRALVEAEAAIRRPEVFGRLVALCFAQRHRDPRRMLEIAEVALLVAQAFAQDQAVLPGPSSLLASDLQAEAWAYLANARRISGEHGEAEACWREARKFLAAGSGDPLLAARLSALEANLRADLRQFADAERQFHRAASLYEAAGDRHLAGRTLLDLARTFQEAGETGKAIATLYGGASRLDLSREPSLFVMVVHNLAGYLDVAGFPAHALRLLQSLRDRRTSRRSRLLLLRARWLEARIAATLGLAALASETLQRVCAGLLDMKLPYDAALAALEMASVYAAENRHEEVQRLAEEVYPVFIARAIPREASLALLLFYRSALARETTQELLSGLESMLRENRRA